MCRETVDEVFRLLELERRESFHSYNIICFNSLYYYLASACFMGKTYTKTIEYDIVIITYLRNQSLSYVSKKKSTV